MQERKICPICLNRPVAVNYRDRSGKTHYRSLCTSCIHKGRRAKPNPPAWYRQGYRKKERCEKCNFKAKYPEDQLGVFYVDGDLRNNNWTNLRTICLNCRQEIYRSRLPWRPADLVPDF